MRQFSPLVAVRERHAEQVIRESKSPSMRTKYRKELDMHRFYRGKISVSQGVQDALPAEAVQKSHRA